MRKTKPERRAALPRGASPPALSGSPGRRPEIKQDPYDVVVRYLASRPHSVAEIRRHLRGKRFADTDIDRAVDQLRAQRYVDDEAFARYWVEQRERFRPKGDRALTSELLEKGVARETIALVLGERDPEAEVKQARAAIRRPLTRWLTLGDTDRKRKIHAYLVSRGFDYATIEAVLAHPREEEEEP